ncbi:MAG: DUF2147 domain-containing protein [Candidatus Hydrogenedentes bacterium]|nr:DUF2147 domain-containing protein [Candidatus Hydrogenedentota bacterium]
MVRYMLIAAISAAFTLGAYAEANDVLGDWYTAGKRSKVQIFEKDGKYHGKIVWLIEPEYPEGDPEAGKPRRDRENPDEDKRNTPIIGLVFMHDFEYEGESEWSSGRIYDPESGKTYKSKMTLEDPDTLNVRGYIGIAAFGRTETWTRVPADEQKQEDAAPAAAQ